VSRRPLVLFDIDGTLCSTEGAGRRAMAQAADELFGRPDLFEGLSFAGAIDGEIARRALAHAGIPPTDRRVGRLRAAYLRRLVRGLAPGLGRIHPGAGQAVQGAVRAGAAVGLLTGNWRQGAELKLRHFDLWRLFPAGLGAFGADAPDRLGLVPVAWRRAWRLGLRPDRILVVGDTPNDVACARAGERALGPDGPRVLSVGVTTGFATEQALRAARPDLLVADLDQGWEALVALLTAPVPRS